MARDLPGVMITAVDTTVVGLALAEIERSLHIALDSVIWVVIGYLLVITVLATRVGRLGDMFGRVRMYEAGFMALQRGFGNVRAGLGRDLDRGVPLAARGGRRLS